MTSRNQLRNVHSLKQITLLKIVASISREFQYILICDAWWVSYGRFEVHTPLHESSFLFDILNYVIILL
jgi:hypothetical protein